MSLGESSIQNEGRAGKSIRAVSRPAGTPGILDAVRDQLGGYWIQFGTADRSVWFSLKELQEEPRKVFSRLSGPGMAFLTKRRRTNSRL